MNPTLTNTYDENGVLCLHATFTNYPDGTPFESIEAALAWGEEYNRLFAEQAAATE